MIDLVQPLDVMLINVAVAVTVVGTLARNRYMARGVLKPMYWCMTVVSLSNMVLNVVIANQQPAYKSVLLFNILLLHTMYSSIKGLRRVYSEST
jgi:hypothetical protein